MKFKHVFVIGAGGIGSHLMEPLARLLAYHANGTKNVTLIDGDSYEEKNETRQLFDRTFLGKNKAEALAARTSKNVFPIEYIPEYINRSKFAEILSDRLKNKDHPFLVVTAVDNHATRHAIIKLLDEENYPNFVFLSGSNGYELGQVLAYVKLLGHAGTTHPFDKYDKVKFPMDHIPGEGCQEEAPAEPQLITANASAALGLLWTISAMLDNAEWYEELHFNTESMKLVPQGDPIKFPEVAVERCKEFEPVLA